MYDSIHNALTTPGEHPLVLEGVVGCLEANLIVPNKAQANLLLFLGHPHSLQGGTMSNKVVTTMARAAREIGIPSLRFNFRGVGKSEGVFDDGIGESDDLLKLVNQVSSDNPDCVYLFAGFSFGSFVVYRAAAQFPHKLLVTVAPPVERYDYQAFSPSPSPWEILMGDADEVVSYGAVEQFASQHQPPITLHRFADAGHFFHGQLISLRQTITPMFQRAICK